MGIEPTLSAWEAEVLPLNYTRWIVRRLALPKDARLQRLPASPSRLSACSAAPAPIYQQTLDGSSSPFADATRGQALHFTSILTDHRTKEPVQ